MTDLPILTPKDLSKAPQSSKDNDTGIVSFDKTVPYFFKYNALYQANDVFIVDEDLGLVPGQVVRNANEEYIPADIKYTGATPTFATDGSVINFAAGVAQEGKNLRNFAAGATNSFASQPGGIAWISNANGIFWANHPRAFDQGSVYAPIIAGARRFTGDPAADYKNLYYLGASIAGYPLYSSSMNFRLQGYRREGLTFSINFTNGFLQTASGFLSNWYQQDLKIPQNGKVSFYYAHREKILNGPTLVVSLTDLDRKDVNGTLTPLAANENAWHFVYLDPSTQLFYIVLWAGDTVTANANYNIDAEIINAHSKTVVPSFLRENGVLLGCIAVQQGKTFAETYLCQLYQYQPGAGSTLHPSVPSPSDFPYGGTLKANNNIYEIKFDYDGYLINIAAEVKNNYLFVYDDAVPRDIAIVEYETTNASLVNMTGMGLMVYIVATSNPSLQVFYFAFVDRFNYQDAEEKGRYSGNFYFHTANVDYPEYVQIAEIKSLGVLEYLPVVASDPNIVYPIFLSSTRIVRQTASYRYTTLIYTARIPGLNNKSQSNDGILNYNDALRSRRKSNGGSDSLVIVEGIIGLSIVRSDLYFWRYISDEARALIDKLSDLIGASLVQQIKTMYALVKRAGLLSDQTNVVWPIIGYHIDNNSSTDILEYALLGSSSIKYTKSTAALSLTPYAVNNQIAIQPMDVVCLESDDITPIQAVFFFLRVRYNYGAFLFSFGNNISIARYQTTEVPLF